MDNSETSRNESNPSTAWGLRKHKTLQVALIKQVGLGNSPLTSALPSFFMDAKAGVNPFQVAKNSAFFNLKTQNIEKNYIDTVCLPSL